MAAGLWPVAATLLSLVLSVHAGQAAGGPMPPRPYYVTPWAFVPVASASPNLSRALFAYERRIDRRAKPTEVRRYKRLFKAVFERVRMDYVIAADPAKLVAAAIGGMDQAVAGGGDRSARAVMEAGLAAMLTSLDPHSEYLSPEDLRDIRAQSRGRFAGLGVEITLDGGLVRVISPIDGTPAHRAGIRAGDRITHLDGQPVRGLTLAQAVKRMRGRKGTAIRLTVQRPGQPPFDVTVVRDIVNVRAVRSRLEGQVGYLRVTVFNQATAPKVMQAVEGFRRQAGPRLRGLVLDLRSNPGGLLDQAVAVADTFLPGGVIVSARARRAADNQQYRSVRGDLTGGLPLVVLVNGGSASSAEIVAAALQDHRRAAILGSRSFGKGSVQTVFPVGGHGAVRLTTAIYYTPADRALQKTGIVPDVIIATEAEADRKRESDLPGALPAAGNAHAASRVTISEDRCPAVGADADRVLGCALAYLRAPSPAAFIDAVNRR